MIKPKIVYPKYSPRFGLGSLAHGTTPHVRDGEILLAALKAGDGHAVMIVAAKILKEARAYYRDNPPKVELVDDTL